MKPIEKTLIWRLVEKLMSVILVAVSVILVLVVGIAVFMRYVMHSTLFGSEEILAILAIWLYWLGGAYGSFEDSHISADMTNIFIRNDKVRRVVKIIVRAITVLITGVFAYWSVFRYAAINIRMGSVTTALRIPQITGRIALSVGFCLMFIYSVYHLIREIHPMQEEDAPGDHMAEDPITEGTAAGGGTGT